MQEPRLRKETNTMKAENNVSTCQRPGCGLELPKGRLLWCSRKCYDLVEGHRRSEHNKNNGTSSRRLGAISECLVAADLLRKGFDVFQAVSDHASCDFIVLKEGVTLRIEVKTLQKSANGRDIFPVRYLQNGRAEVLAFVARDGSSIVYRPDPAILTLKTPPTLASQRQK